MTLKSDYREARCMSKEKESMSTTNIPHSQHKYINLYINKYYNSDQNPSIMNNMRADFVIFMRLNYEGYNNQITT